MQFVVNGGRKLSGEIEVFGSKNAATPTIAATILTTQPCFLSNVPKIGDVLTLLTILESMGSRINWEGEILKIDNSNLDPATLNMDLVRSIRSSVLLIGPMLARFGKFSFATPGGCHIGVRPLDAHLEALKEIGVSVEYDAVSDIYELKPLSPGKLRNKVVLTEFSVTATENLMMLGTAMPSLEIELAAAEPHVQNLGGFLEKLGFAVGGLGTHNIRISGNRNTSAAEISHSVMPDPIEAGTFMVLGALATESLSIRNVPVAFMVSSIKKLQQFGVDLRITDDTVTIKNSLKNLKATKIQTLPYPGFPTDLQAPYGVLATQSEGSSLIFDTLYEGRLRYIHELQKMGAQAEILDDHRAIIHGPTPLHGAEIKSLDLRAGATLVIAALIAEGRSTLNDAEQIDRGYARLEERLRLLGAGIERIK
ncbi:MAG TPA: UDP-N-acetylglucosamine 1-carboxyvinyltransferase [Candidatus Paceibacterota bacterium]|nr:UDP-N-acetylglucosamine 1-carboxyvinyltransferase [Candidatus Paceibacterota bacterium]